MIRFALIVASTLGFVLTAALGNFMAPLLQELERFRPQEQQEPQTPVQSRVPTPTAASVLTIRHRPPSAGTRL